MRSSAITVTDQFCGAGGSSLGATMAGCEVKLAMNHWKLAIETHNTNFPDTTHVLADMSQVDPRRYPTTEILITSPECTNHSIAKGKQRKNLAQLDLWGNGNRIDPAEERSRATMWDVPRFAEFHKYRFVIVENVVDARYWVMWDAWIHAMQLLGYNYKVVYFNSMFAPPTPQSRDRMYVVFWLKGNRAPDLDIRPLAYCPKCGKNVEAVQAWKKQQWGKYNQQYIYICPVGNHGQIHPYANPAATAIDWSLKGERIGDRAKPLAAKTMQRIERGLERYGSQPLLVRNFSPGYSRPVTEPTGAITTQDHHSLVTPSFVLSYYSRDDASSDLADPLPTVTTEPRHGIVGMPFMLNYYNNEAPPRPVDQPSYTMATRNIPGLVIPPAFLIEYYGKSDSRSVADPLSTIPTISHHGLVLDFRYSNPVTPTDEPMTVVTTREEKALIESLNRSVDDCHFRMLQPHEIQKAMAFPDWYQVLGNKRNQNRLFGNAVTPPVMEILLKRCVETLQ